MEFSFRTWLLYLTVLMLACLALPSDAVLQVYRMQGGTGLNGDAMGNPPDPYVKVFVRGKLVGQTDVRRDSSNPVWTNTVKSSLANINDDLRLEVWDEDLNFDDLLGECYAHVQSGHHTFRCNLNKGGTLTYSTEF